MGSCYKKCLFTIFISMLTLSQQGRAESSGEVVVLSAFQKCAQQGQDLSDFGKCTKSFFAEEVTQKQRKRLLAWFLSNPDLAVKACDDRQQAKGAKKYSGKDVSFICARAKEAHENESDALLVFRKTDGHHKFLNLSQ